MILLMRHGKDDASRLGGWSDAGLTQSGIEQVKNACKRFADNAYDIRHIFASDLQRAKETADIVAKQLELPVQYLKAFRETNNGDLAGISKIRFKKEYPGLYYSALGWEQQYPSGESPKQFYERIKDAWAEFKSTTSTLEGNILLVTHAGVIDIICCIEAGLPYTNKEGRFLIGHAEIIDPQKRIRDLQEKK